MDDWNDLMPPPPDDPWIWEGLSWRVASALVLAYAVVLAGVCWATVALL